MSTITAIFANASERKFGEKARERLIELQQEHENTGKADWLFNGEVLLMVIKLELAKQFSTRLINAFFKYSKFDVKDKNGKVFGYVVRTMRDTTIFLPSEHNNNK